MITAIITVENPSGKIREWKKVFERHSPAVFMWFIESIKPTISKSDKVTGRIMEAME